MFNLCLSFLHDKSSSEEVQRNSERTKDPLNIISSRNGNDKSKDESGEMDPNLNSKEMKEVKNINENISKELRDLSEKIEEKGKATSKEDKVYRLTESKESEETPDSVEMYETLFDPIELDYID